MLVSCRRQCHNLTDLRPGLGCCPDVGLDTLVAPRCLLYSPVRIVRQYALQVSWSAAHLPVRVFVWGAAHVTFADTMHDTWLPVSLGDLGGCVLAIREISASATRAEPARCLLVSGQPEGALAWPACPPYTLK